MHTATMDDMMRQRNPEPKEAVEARLAGEIARAVGRLGGNVAEFEPDNIASAVVGQCDHAQSIPALDRRPANRLRCASGLLRGAAT